MCIFIKRLDCFPSKKIIKACGKARFQDTETRFSLSTPTRPETKSNRSAASNRTDPSASKNRKFWRTVQRHTPSEYPENIISDDECDAGHALHMNSGDSLLAACVSETWHSTLRDDFFPPKICACPMKLLSLEQRPFPPSRTGKSASC